MAGLCAPLSTLRQYPHGYLRMTRGRCGSLLLHRDGLAPSTPCRSPGALRISPHQGFMKRPRIGIVRRLAADAVGAGQLGPAPAVADRAQQALETFGRNARAGVGAAHVID